MFVSIAVVPTFEQVLVVGDEHAKYAVGGDMWDVALCIWDSRGNSIHTATGYGDEWRIRHKSPQLSERGRKLEDERYPTQAAWEKAVKDTLVKEFGPDVAIK